MSVEVNLRDLIQHKRNLLEQLSADIKRMSDRRDSILNLVVELESLFTQDDQKDQEGEEFRLGGSEGTVVHTKSRHQPIPEEDDDLPNVPSWSDSSASIHKEAMPKGERFEHVVPRKGRPMPDRPQA